MLYLYNVVKADYLRNRHTLAQLRWYRNTLIETYGYAEDSGIILEMNVSIERTERYMREAAATMHALANTYKSCLLAHKETIAAGEWEEADRG